jgi:hypothetical protein
MGLTCSMSAMLMAGALTTCKGKECKEAVNRDNKQTPGSIRRHTQHIGTRANQRSRMEKQTEHAAVLMPGSSRHGLPKLLRRKAHQEVNIEA